MGLALRMLLAWFSFDTGARPALPEPSSCAHVARKNPNEPLTRAYGADPSTLVLRAQPPIPASKRAGVLPASYVMNFRSESVTKSSSKYQAWSNCVTQRVVARVVILTVFGIEGVIGLTPAFVSISEENVIPARARRPDCLRASRTDRPSFEGVKGVFLELSISGAMDT
ncbi:hypothetical protein B0H14DRAFT_2565930 [Mycena olivaceomarginata]|nr:hypothetical protein B0H14DRAFT_2565930 [Mycena olivaceomarginata]